MYEVALSVAACLRAGTTAHVAWIVDGTDLPPRRPNDALVITAGGGRMGGLLDGALDDLVVAAVADGSVDRLVALTVDDLAAMISGLPAGATARCLIVAADRFPAGVWDEFQAGEPVGVGVTLEGDRVTGVRRSPATASIAALGRAHETTIHLLGSECQCSWFPVPRLVVVGRRPIADALEQAAGPLGWRVLRADDAAQAAPVLLALGPKDAAVVVLHDGTDAGEALQAALSGRVGYLAALGSVGMADARRRWLEGRQVDGLDRIHTPAGLDIGARGPGEMAIAILAQAIAVLRGRSGPAPG